MKNFYKLSAEEKIQYIDDKMRCSPYTSSYQSWFINTWDSISKVVALERAQDLQHQIEKYAEVNPQSRKHAIVVVHALHYINEFGLKPNYIAVLFALMDSPVFQNCYYELHTGNHGIKSEYFDGLLPERPIMIKIDVGDLQK